MSLAISSFCFFVQKMNRKSLEDNEDVIFPHDQVILTFIVEFLAGILAVENDIAHLDGHQIPILSRAYCYNLPALGLFFGGIGNDDPTFGFFLSRSWFYYNPVVYWFHSTSYCFVKWMFKKSKHSFSIISRAKAISAVNFSGSGQQVFVYCQKD
jgi:hypothetical protein